jgi:uncharacterized protein with GYD domain
MEAHMAAYFTLGNWTEQGVHTVKDTVNRGEAAKKLAESLGGRLIGIWWTIGKYDFIAITEFPDDATFSRFALTTTLGGNIRTTSMRAFSEDEMQQIIQSLP